LDWGLSVADAVADGVPGDVVDLFGPDAVCWRCSDCGEWGFFGSMEFG
jgi:hypothetical protein